jgi:3-deoxy-D-manno-octulosonate 8-phosphate phosphatase (KDO 8-P phosphatase)
VAFDVDGVIFSGRVFVHPETGEMLKERSHIDGHGISLLREAGIKIAFITAEKTGFARAVCDKLNSLSSVKEKKWAKIDLFTGHMGKDKAEIINGWLEKNKIKWEECAAMGDDIIDYQLLKKAGFAVAPAQAEKAIKKIADYITEREGGNGAIRDFCDLILEAKKYDKF